MNHTTDIHIDWDGPMTFEEARACKGDTDWGIYQIYGFHPVYGSSSLLYIGKAEKQRLGARLEQHDTWERDADHHCVTVYLGRLAGEDAPEDDTWCLHITLAERLLIFVHRPAFNSQMNIHQLDKELQQVHVFNWGAHRHLLAEVSGARWSSRLNTMTRWHVFNCNEPRLPTMQP